MKKAILLSIKPKWVAKILNGEKTIEIRKNEALYKATMKLIDEYGYATFFMYCTNDIKQGRENFYFEELNRLGHVVAKFTVRKVEDIEYLADEYCTETYRQKELIRRCLLTNKELSDYLNHKVGYAYHIEDLVIFDEPKELSEFSSFRKPYWNKKTKEFIKEEQKKFGCRIFKVSRLKPLTKAPQNFCYVESEE